VERANALKPEWSLSSQTSTQRLRSAERSTPKGTFRGGYVTNQSLDASDPEHLTHALEFAGVGCTAIITNTPHDTDESCAIVRNLFDLVEAQQVDFVAALFRSIWGAEPGRLAYLNRPSFFGEILCCWRPRWIVGSQGSPMHAYAWYVWRKEPRSRPSLKVRVGRREIVAALSAVNLPMRGSRSRRNLSGMLAPILGLLETERFEP
jgi:hypothetical protein